MKETLALSAVALLLLCVTAKADGNITSSGNLFLSPGGGAVVLDGRLDSTDSLVRLQDGKGLRIVADEGLQVFNEDGDRFLMIGRGLDLAAVNNRPVIAFNSVNNNMGFYFRKNGLLTWYIHMAKNQNFIFRDRITGANSLILEPEGNVLFGPAGGKVLPEAHKGTDFGSPQSSWGACYCDEYHTTSRGYLGDGQGAYDAVSKIRTLSDGEVDHDSIDPSLREGDESVSINSVTFANSKAITYLMQRIESLEDENRALRESLGEK